jgi:TfoX/Sxy family transcriptional regulator of competence genes
MTVGENSDSQLKEHSTIYQPLFVATRKETVDFILQKLGHGGKFSARPMFGEYGLYCEEKVVALICDNLLYVKILPASQELEAICEKGPPYPGAKLHYIIDEGQLSTILNLPAVLRQIGDSLLDRKKKQKKA